MTFIVKGDMRQCSVYNNGAEADSLDAENFKEIHFTGNTYEKNEIEGNYTL